MGPSLRPSEDRGRIGLRTLASYIAEWQRGADAFRVRHPHPVLIYRREQEGDDVEPAFLTAHGAMLQGATLPLRPHPALSTPAAPSQDEVLVYPVAKRPEGVFQERISIGRTRNMDICVSSPKVSKLHAYVTVVPAAPGAAEDPGRTRYLLSDAGSTNGTFVNGQRLVQDQPAPLSDQDVVQLGKLTFRFHLPAGFYRLLGQPGGARSTP